MNLFFRFCVFSFAMVCGVSHATAQPLYKRDVLIQKRKIVTEVPKLTCENFTTSDLGLSFYKQLPEIYKKDAPDLGLEIRILRDLGLNRNAWGKNTSGRDLVFAFQYSGPQNLDAIRFFMGHYGFVESDFAEPINCFPPSQPGLVPIWEDFLSETGSEPRTILRAPLIFSIEYLVADHSPPTASEGGPNYEVGANDGRSDTSADGDGFGLEGYYPWAAQANLKDLVDGERAISVEKVDCSDEGVFVIASIGKVLRAHATNSDVTNGGSQVELVREELIASNVNFGITGDDASRSDVEASIDPQHYWCVPKREICYEQVKFGSFGLKLRKGRSTLAFLKNTYNLRLGVVTALQRIALDECLGG